MTAVSEPARVRRGVAEPRVVIAHDFMEAYGGAERVTEEMARTFPDAPVFAILGRRSVAERMGIVDRFHSVLPAGQGLMHHYRALTPIYPALLALHHLPAADVLLTSSYAFAHRFSTRNHAPQVCYCHTPIRFAWTVTASYRDAFAPTRALGRAFGLMAAAMRASDRRSARRVYRYLTQSAYTVEQIERFYGRRAEAIGAPVDCERFRPCTDMPCDYFLLCSRLFEASKRVSYVVDAFRSLPDTRLVVAGGGPAQPALQASAPPNVDFVGHLDDDQLIPLMQRCRALIFPSHDAFGLIPVETMACGRPVIAFAKGGALLTVIPGLSGALFQAQTARDVAQAVTAFRDEDYDPARIRQHALQWDSPRFRERVREAVLEACETVTRMASTAE